MPVLRVQRRLAWIVALPAGVVIAGVGAGLINAMTDHAYDPPPLTLDASTEYVVGAFHLRLSQESLPPAWLNGMPRLGLAVIAPDEPPGPATPYLVAAREGLFFNGEPVPTRSLDEGSLLLPGLIGAASDWTARNQTAPVRVFFDRDVSASFRRAVLYSLLRVDGAEVYIMELGEAGVDAILFALGAR